MKDTWNLDRIYRGFEDPAYQADLARMEATAVPAGEPAEESDGAELPEIPEEPEVPAEPLEPQGMEILFGHHLDSAERCIIVSCHACQYINCIQQIW